MKLSLVRPGSAALEPAGTGEAGNPGFGLADAAFAGLMVTLVLGISVPWATQLRQEAVREDQERAQVISNCRQLNATLRFLSERRQATLRLRRAVGRLTAEVDARPRVVSADAVGELSRRKPAGVRATALRGDGPRFRAVLTAQRPELLDAYVRGLGTSPFVEFAGVAPTARADSANVQVVGRLRGE